MDATRRCTLLGLLSSMAAIAGCSGPSGASGRSGADAPARAGEGPKFDPPREPSEAEPPRADDGATPEPKPEPDADAEPTADAASADAASPDAASPEEIAAAVAGLNAFAAELYVRAASGAGDRVISPASVAMALAMVHAGAKGATADEIARALHQPSAGASLSRVGASLLAGWNATDKSYELAVVDRLFGDAKVPFEKAYLAAVARDFRAPLETMDFAGAPDPSRERINAWVEEQTKDRIQNLLPAGAVTSATKLVLVNAIYFKAAWYEEFQAGLTKEEPFYAPAGKTTAKMMQRTDHFRFAEVPDAKLRLVELPYQDDATSMVIVLPDARDGLGKIEKALTGETIATWISKLASERVEVKLPKFRIEMPEPLTLSTILKDLGIKRAFDYTQADFTPMAPASEQLEISEGYHKAFIEVDEKGTEAAAATALGMRAGAAAPTDPPKPFTCDHPFLFMIRDRKTDTILFMGRVTEPKTT